MALCFTLQKFFSSPALKYPEYAASATWWWSTVYIQARVRDRSSLLTRRPEGECARQLKTSTFFFFLISLADKIITAKSHRHCLSRSIVLCISYALVHTRGACMYLCIYYVVLNRVFRLQNNIVRTRRVIATRWITAARAQYVCYRTRIFMFLHGAA